MQRVHARTLQSKPSDTPPLILKSDPLEHKGIPGSRNQNNKQT